MAREAAPRIALAPRSAESRGYWVPRSRDDGIFASVAGQPQRTLGIAVEDRRLPRLRNGEPARLGAELFQVVVHVSAQEHAPLLPRERPEHI